MGSASARADTHLTMLGPLSLALLLITTQAHVQDSLLENLLEDIQRQEQLVEQYPDPDYQYTDAVYDGDTGLAGGVTVPRALHKNYLRQQTKQGKQMKSSMLPAYCDPPNPCPLGYTAQDGCIEEFENKADFSQKYQAAQNCMCDTEHMFSCPDEMMKQQEPDLSFFGLPGVEDIKNPFLAGTKLPIAAKKGLGF